MPARTRVLLIVLCLAASPSPAQDAPAFELQAHRGGMGLVAEGTLEAFANALALGVTTLELDTQLTADGRVVVTHDRQVQARNCRDTGPAFPDDPQFPYVGKYIKDLTLAQVRMLDCGSNPLPDYPEQRAAPGAGMPLLQEVIDLLRLYEADAVRLNVETKVEAGAPHETAPQREFVTAVLEVIAAAGRQDRVTIQSFDWGALRLVRELAPALPRVALTNGQSFLRCGEPGRSPWLGGLDMDDFGCDLVAAAASIGVTALSPVHGQPQEGRVGEPGYEPFVTRAMVAAAHARGLPVIPWTVDDPATMHYLMDLGVDGLITNYPDRLRAVMAARGLPLPPAYPRPADCARRLTAGMNPRLCSLGPAVVE